MRQLKLNLSSNSDIVCGEGAFARFAPPLKSDKMFVITDSNVFALYRKLIWEAFGDYVPVYIFPAGEKSKILRYLTEILTAMHEKGVQRNWRVIAFGGGVVGDIAGLAAALYMRGTHLTQIPTTLLAQVDSSVGGKTAVDFAGVKNLLGTFYQPEQVIVDPLFLESLPAREVRCGLGEIVKYAALDGDIYDTLIQNAKKLTDVNFLGGMVFDCIKHKAAVVEGDEKDEGGARKSLNMGHTTGHALELYCRKRSHGEYVMEGMYYELYIALKKGICDTEYAARLKELLICALGKSPFEKDIAAAAQKAKFDKKNTGGGITLIVPKARGEWAELTLETGEYISLLTQCNGDRNL